MVTKGIITSIDFNGNTCQVRIPFFETAGNDPITGTAIVSNTPGSYNGYKVGDVVLVAFEEGKMQNPVIVGKLYLGAAKEKQDPRGTINVETTTASKSASLPADAVLTANVDSNVPNTNAPFGSLASIANNLNSLNTDVNQLDKFTRNQFNSVITDVNDQGEQLRSEIEQTAKNIRADVVHKHQDGSQNALGWDLDVKEWKINAQDTVNGVVKDINIVTIDRSGMSIAGDLKLSGYPKNTTVLYAQNNSDKNYPTPLYNFTEAEFPTPFPSGDEDKDKTWYYGKYIKIEENYVLIFKENFEHYKKLIDLGITKAYNREVNSKVWSTETPKRDDGQYIWQWTHTEIYSFDGDKWDEQDDDKVVCITGAKGTSGTPATAYWAKLSTAVHTGKNQKSDIEITPYTKTGSSPEAVDTTAYFKYSLNNGTTWNSDNWTLLQDNKIIILANDIIADNIIVKLAHAYTDPGNTSNIIYSEYETETITYSPLNTPIIDLNNDTDVIKYKPDGNKITADVSSTAQVYLGGSPEDASYNWTVTSGTATISKSNSNQTVTVTSITSDKAIITCTATTTNFKNKNGNSVTITKDFVVSKEVVVASYWLSFSPVHTGNLQQTDIEVKALAKIGNDGEGPDENAYLRYKWDNESNWSDWNKNATLIISKADIKNYNLRIQATHASTGTNRQVYEDETVTYSPLNTPVLDLTNDSDAIAYDDNTILGNSVSSTAIVYLNGSVISGCTFAWTATNCTISGAADSATVTVSAIDDNKSEGTATCRVTLIPNYRDTELVKVFTVAKQYKGNKGTDGPTPTSSTTYYIYSADTPSLDDPKWKTDPANLDKPSGGYFCWTKTVTTYSDGKTITDGPNKDAAFALAQGKSTNYYSPTAPSVNIQKGDCWFKTISSTDGEYNNEMSDRDQGALYQCSGFDADGKAIWEDVGGELVANKLTANYINALDITARKIHINDDNGKTLFKANGIPGEADSNKVTIGGFDVTKDALVGGDFSTDNYCKLNILDTFNSWNPDEIPSSSLIIGDSTWIQKGDSNYTHGSSDNITWEKATYVDGAGTQSQQCIYNGITTYKCNSTKAIKNSTAGNAIISCMVLKPNKGLIEKQIKDALNIKGDEPIPTVNFSTTLNLGIESPSDVTTTSSSQYDYIIASTPFKLTDFGENATIENIIGALFEKQTDLSAGIFTSYEKIQEYARATGPRSIGGIENLTKVIYPSLTTDHYIAIFMVNVQKTYFTTSTTIYDYDSSGNVLGTPIITENNYTLPTYGYCCVPDSVEIALQALEIGTNFKVKTDGTMVANNAFVTGTLNIPDTAVIGGFNISKNTLTSSTLNIDSNKVTISSFKPLILGKNFKLISTPDTVGSAEIWKSKISSLNPLEILGENSILISNTAALSSTQNASILLETTTKSTTSGSQVIKVGTSPGTSSTTRSSDSTTYRPDSLGPQRPSHDIHFVDGSGSGGSVSTKYTTKATITATVYENSTNNAKEEAAEAPYSIKVYYMFDSTWYSTTISIQKGTTTASATVSASRSTGYPSYHGISKNSSSSASLTPLTYPVSYTLSNEEITYTPKITANGNLTVEGNVYGNAFYASSDRELKTNIETINIDSNLDKFYQQLQPVKFNFKTDLNAQHFGFIAQDLNDALSSISTDNTTYSIVNKDDKTGYYKVNYNEMVALNAAQIKNIMNYIKDLQSQYEALKVKYKELEEKINENR